MISLKDVVDLVHMHAVLSAEDIRHRAIDFADHHLGAFNNRALPNVRGAKVEISALVHGTGLENGDVYRGEKAPVIIGHLSKIQRNVVAAAGVMLSPVVPCEVPAEHVEVLTFRIALDDRAWAHRET